MKRNLRQKILDFLTFPIRGFTLHYKDKWGLSCLATERFDLVATKAKGFCLDIGCGPHNRFIQEFLKGNGIGIDIYRYDGLDDDNIVEDMTRLPFDSEAFDTVTFIANINHVPEPDRDAELAEACRCLKPGGMIIVTMGNPIVEVLVHKVIQLSDRFFGTSFDIDSERGMKAGEAYYLTDREIKKRLTSAGFSNLKKKYFWTQWFLNHMFVGFKENHDQDKR
jgi:SAM-dependent methyltransferase